MPKKSDVWNHFTPIKDDSGNIIVGKAKCNNCPDNKEFDTKAGTTNMWRHFLKHSTRTIPDDQGNDKGIVQCSFCQTKFKASAATSSLVQHVEACNKLKQGAASMGASAVQTGALSGFGSSSMDLEPGDDIGAQQLPLPSAPARSAGGSSSGWIGPDMDEPSKRLARMIALHGFDPSIVENDGFKSFVESFNPEYRVPRRVEIEDACDYIFHKATQDIHGSIYHADICGTRISLAVGKAKIMEREVLHTAYHFIDDEWNLHKVILNVELDGPFPYHLRNLDNRIKQICVQTHLVEVVSFICDRIYNYYDDDDIFMMAWGITKEHSILKSSIDQKFPSTSAVRGGLVCTTFMDVLFHSVAEHLYLQIDAKFREDMHSRKILSTRQQREEILSHVGVDLWAYKEAWYSWYCFLVVLHNRDQETNSELIRLLCNIPREETESELTRLLCNIWGGIYRAIKTVSTPKLPASNLCLLEMFNVKKILESELAALASAGRTAYHRGRTVFIEGKDVTTVLKEVIEILDKAIQESYLVWSIPLVLDPRYKLAGTEEAFRGAFGEAAASSYISKSRDHIKVMYSDYLKGFDGSELAEAQAELDRYLNIYVVHPTEGFDILEWWKLHGSGRYPTVALMAGDALAMPTSSQLSSEQIAHVKSDFVVITIKASPAINISG